MKDRFVIKLCIFVMICLLCCSCSFSKSVNIDINKIIQNIVSYDNNFNSDFLEYINDNFGSKVLIEVNDSINNNSYNDKLWHDITGKSYKVLLDEYSNVYENNNRVKVINNNGDTVINFVGDISLADNFDIMPCIL